MQTVRSCRVESKVVETLLSLANKGGIVVGVLAIEVEPVDQGIELGKLGTVARGSELLAQDAYLLMCLDALDELLETYRAATIGVYHIGVARGP